MYQDPTEYDNSANAEGKMSYRERLHKQLKCSYCPPNKVATAYKNPTISTEIG